MGNITDNLKAVLIELPPHVTLVAVSKTYPPEAVLEAYSAGQRDFGENKVQELVTKYESSPKDIRWHLIGHLQSNKVKYIAPFVNLIHSVDSEKLLQEINKQAARNNRTISVLLQVYIAAEETKFGLSEEELAGLFEKITNRTYPNVAVKGLMGMATNTDNTDQIRKEFQKLMAFRNKLRTAEIPLETLSFGMSSDYTVAIEEGSNMVRIGSRIFGARH